MFRRLPLINGQSFPHVPPLRVREGELVRVVIVNRGRENHPVHIHGHHALVLARDGEPSRGSPCRVDTFDVRPGGTFEIAFRADNPGLWVDHCHNLAHSRLGMTMHLGYEGVTSPYFAGQETGNIQE